MNGTEIGSLLKQCSDKSGPACGSVFCQRCRTKKQNNLYGSYKRYMKKAFGNDEQLARDRLRFVSVLHSVIPVHHKTANLEYGSIGDVIDAISGMKEILKN